MTILMQYQRGRYGHIYLVLSYGMAVLMKYTETGTAIPGTAMPRQYTSMVLPRFCHTRYGLT